MNDNLNNRTNKNRQRKSWAWEDKQLTLHSYFRSNPTLRGYRKRMIEIWQECAWFQTASQRLADQVRTIIKKGWFSDLEIQVICQKTIFRKYRKNILPKSSGDGVKSWSKKWQPREHNKKAEWISNLGKELDGLKEGLKAKAHIDLPRTTQKKSNWKTPGHDGIDGFWFKKFTSTHDRLALKRNGCLQESNRKDDQRKGHIDPKRPP